MHEKMHDRFSCMQSGTQNSLIICKWPFAVVLTNGAAICLPLPV